MKNFTIVLANGAFPVKGSLARSLLEKASRVICCDGAAGIYRRIVKREPDAVVGDCDSLKGDYKCIVKIPEQQTNDLEKAVRYAKRRGWSDIVVLGATGKREDHTIGNVFRALDLNVEIITDRGRFIPVKGRFVFDARPGCAVSIFAPEPGTQARSKGLQWPLDGVVFKKVYTATLNRAVGGRVEINSSKRILVFVSF